VKAERAPTNGEAALATTASPATDDAAAKKARLEELKRQAAEKAKQRKGSSE
jgi:hypothetical protein